MQRRDPWSSGSGRQSIEPKRIILETEDLVEFPLLSFDLPGTYYSFFLLFLHFGMEMPILCLEAHNLSGFTGSQLERNFASE